MKPALVPLGVILAAGLPCLSAQGRALVEAVLTHPRRERNAGGLARLLGLPSRFSLRRFLRREGLPPLEALDAWMCVLTLLHRAESRGESLQRVARQLALEPPAAYRLVRRLTGVTWRLARDRGLGWAVVQFLSKCSPRRPAHA